MTGRHKGHWRWITCPSCGKRSYSSRQDAKAALRSIPEHQGMGVYRCLGSDMWHCGHRGELSRAEHRERHEGKTA